MKHSKEEKFQAMFKVLARWGDVVPLVYEFGTSLTTTDIEKNTEEVMCVIYTILETLTCNLAKLVDFVVEVIKAGKNIYYLPTNPILQGGKGQGTPEGGINNWMSQELEGPDWRIVRVMRVVSTIDLLDHELQQQLASLYASVLSFDPPLLDGKTDIYPTWDDTPHAMKAMSKVVVRCGIRICGLSAAYRDGSQSNSYGLTGTEHVFEPNTGEYITDVVVWVNDDYISAIQFVTTTGRFSPIYGGYLGVPKILSSAGGVLAGFSGRMTKPRDNQDTVGRVQTVWRHDITHSFSLAGNRQTTYIGGAGGQPLNDWPFIGSPHSTYISQVDIWCRNGIAGIQASRSSVISTAIS
ncbi:hypothetical protein FRC12_002802 [Ceratobasidium sp. 428]|nr:hypothetical protein FRC12_002802 [Ceratobasidium sp. 428]